MLNKTVIQARLTKDPELRTTPGGRSVTSFTLAWSEKYKEREEKLFLPCVVWGSLAELASRHFTKGQEIVVEGKLTSRKWQDKDGNNRETVELIADRLHFCGPKRDAAPTYNSAPAEFSELPEDDSSLPF